MSKIEVDTSENNISEVTEQCKCIDTTKYETYLKYKITAMTSLSIVENILLILFVIYRYYKNKKKDFIFNIILGLISGGSLIQNIVTLIYNIISCDKDCKNKDNEYEIIYILNIKILSYIILFWLFNKCETEVTLLSVTNATEPE